MADLVAGAVQRSNRSDPAGDVELIAVSRLFGAFAAVDDVTLRIGRGEFFSLLGPSGCGKTTTLRMIGGFELPSSGDIHIRGRSMGVLPPNKRPTNMVFQQLALFPHLTVFENVAFGLRLARTAESEVNRRVGEVIALVSLGGFENRMASQLSGGQQQRVALARALVNEPAVLLLDEPFAALDLKLRVQMQGELKAIQRRLGTTFVFVTHDQGEAFGMSDRVALMNGGRIEQLGTPRDLYDRPLTRFVAGFVGETNLLDATIADVSGSDALAEADGLRFGIAANGVKPGDKVVLSLRPERIAVVSSGKGDGVAATIEGMVFQGPVVRLSLRAGAGRRLEAIVLSGDASGLDPSVPVEVLWHPGSVVVLRS